MSWPKVPSDLAAEKWKGGQKKGKAGVSNRVTCSPEPGGDGGAIGGDGAMFQDAGWQLDREQQRQQRAIPR